MKLRVNREPQNKQSGTYRQISIAMFSKNWYDSYYDSILFYRIYRDRTGTKIDIYGNKIVYTTNTKRRIIQYVRYHWRNGRGSK